MAKTLESGRHDEVAYNRPNQVWACGHLCEGRACALGPDAKGACRGGAECLPLRNGDRWNCTRPGIMGGPCADGPLADGSCCRSLARCSPQRTQRSLRGRVSLAVVALTVGLLLAGLAGHRQHRDQLTTAGPLSTAHASEGMRCEDCHTGNWDPSLLASGDLAALHAGEMSANCLECHANMAGESAESAGFSHGLSPGTLARLGPADGESEDDADGQADRLLRWVSHGVVPVRGLIGELSCETCHSEHHGKDASLTDMGNQQCQICHQQQFASFSEGHPSFADTGYPYRRRTRLIFDHASHYGKHFSGEKAENAPDGFLPSDGSAGSPGLAESESCKSCHQTDERDEHMLVRNFEQTCAACHQDAVSGGEPIPLLTLPSLPISDDDVGDGKGAPAVVNGRWPEIEEGAFPLTPLMVALLPHDAATAAAKLEFETFGEEETGQRYLLAEVDSGDSRRIAAAIQDVWQEVWEEGVGALDRRLAANGWPVEDAPAGGSLFAGLSLDSVRSLLFPGDALVLAELRFPKLDTERLNEFLRSRNRSLGVWPKRAAIELSQPLRLLLEQNPRARAALDFLEAKPNSADARLGTLFESGKPLALSRRQPQGDGQVGPAIELVKGAEPPEDEDERVVSLGDLSGASFRQLRAAEELAWQIKALFARFNQGQGADLIRRLLALEGGILNGLSDVELLGNCFGGARRDEAMVAGFEEEFAAFLQGSFPAPIPVATPEPSKGTGAAPSSSGGDDDFGAAPADDDFGSDPKPAKPAADDDFGAAPANDDFGGEPKPAKPPADDDFGAAPADDDFGGKPKPAKPADDEFGAAPADDDFGGKPKPAKPADDEFGAAPADDDFGGQKKADTAKVETPAAPPKPPSEPGQASEWQAGGGWFFDSNGAHALNYVTQGHADPILRRWLDVLTEASSSSDDRVRADAQLVLGATLGFREGWKTRQSGKCLKCHSVDVTARDNRPPLYRINWHAAFARSDEEVHLTRFDHGKHTFAIDCIQCHSLASAAAAGSQPGDAGGVEYSDFFSTANRLLPGGELETLLRSNDPQRYRSNFEAMDHQKSCANCHQPHLAGNSCLQCHLYHQRPHSMP